MIMIFGWYGGQMVKQQQVATSLYPHLLENRLVTLRLSMHLFWCSRFAICILDLWHPATGLWALVLTIPQCSANIALLGSHLHIHFIWAFEVILHSGNDVDVDVRHRLSCLGPVLYGYGEAAGLGLRLGEVNPCEKSLRQLYCGEQVGCLIG